MRKLPVLILAATLGLTACTDPYGRVDPLATGLLAAGFGAVAGLAIASANRPHTYHPRYAHAPRYAYGRPAYGRPAYGYGRPPPAWRPHRRW
jgi:hypothetical protein